MEKKSKKSIIIGIALLLIITLTLLGLTYAYYRTRIIGNQNDKSISVTSTKLEVVYSDDNATIIAEGVSPGYTAEKAFTVTNTGNETVNYSIKLDNVVNTFTRNQDWVWHGSEDEKELQTSDWTFVLIDETGNTVVEGAIAASTTYLVNKVSIEANTTDTYTLKVTYLNLPDVDQSEDMGKELSFRINIDDAIDNYLTNASEGTLLAAISENNFISEPLTVPGKAASGNLISSGEFSENNTVNVSSGGRNTYYWKYGTGYEYDEESGVYTLTGLTVTDTPYSTSYSSLIGKYLVGELLQGTSSTYEGAVQRNIDNYTTLFKIMDATEDTIVYQTVSSSITRVTEAVLASTEDDYGTSYYYRGDVKNNYLTYSGMCWRIVRIDGNGNIKLVLADENFECSADVAQNADGSYSGYNTLNPVRDVIYGESFKYRATATDTAEDVIFETSDIPAVLETWKNRSEKPLDTSKLVEAEWCNDTSFAFETGEGYDSSGKLVLDKELASEWYRTFDFGANDRIWLRNKANPTLKCNQIGIENTKSTKYINNIGLLSADEYAFAGATTTKTSGDSYYYYLQNWNSAITGYWTMSPSRYYEDSYGSYMVHVNAYGYFNTNVRGGSPVTGSGAVRPSIVLRSDVQISSGDGTQSNPYVVS